MGKRITIDPITRIEGHLRIDCEVNNGKVSKAWASGQMWRGVEQILLGHDARDACGFGGGGKPRVLRIVAVEHGGAARLDAGENFRLGVGDRLF